MILAVRAILRILRTVQLISRNFRKNTLSVPDGAVLIEGVVNHGQCE